MDTTATTTPANRPAKGKPVKSEANGNGGEGDSTGRIAGAKNEEEEEDEGRGGAGVKRVALRVPAASQQALRMAAMAVLDEDSDDFDGKASVSFCSVQ